MTAANHPQWAQSDTDLTGRSIAVIGGAGGVGEGVVQSLLHFGATVVAAGRSSANLEGLATRSGAPTLNTEVLDALAPDLDETATRLAAKYGVFDGVIVAVASWGDQGQKPVLSLSDDEWDQLLAANITAVFRLYRAFIPHVAPGGVLIQLNGMSAEIPFPGNAGVALSAAAGKSLTRTLAAELQDAGPRVYEVILGVIRTRSRQLAGIDDPGWIPARDIGVHVAELIGGNSPLAGIDLHYVVDPVQGPRSRP
ncbi:SDR family oxidoreductase [Nesterenkonia ebinurensis]|uniref:SDR family oxidoreductase n=1 Tax=Nesterenkonia ebinurensis TaxID=2608252 RepID=UPI00123D9386|nr:SDR family oxidoreductase [Nesterenkonia ebinurensis]